TTFVLGTRDLASYEREGVPLDLSAVTEAAIACARLEDDLIFNGLAKLRLPGLLNVPGHNKVKLSPWEKPGDAAEDVIKSLTALDSSGFHGPYSLALAPSRYNLLFRRYPQGNQTEMEHLQSMVTAGIFKAPILKDGGVLLASGVQYASIVIGQDMSIGFIGPSNGDLEFSISESLVLRVRQPKSICVLEA
ncbi:MAG: family 1 encapsulin nanocompartment shell protein, partial [Anaerolineae bacterium]